VYAQFPTWISGKQAAEGGFASGKRRTASRSILVLNRTNVNDNARHLFRIEGKILCKNQIMKQLCANKNAARGSGGIAFIPFTAPSARCTGA
jgi:hypothetical protein